MRSRTSWFDTSPLLFTSSERAREKDPGEDEMSRNLRSALPKPPADLPFPLPTNPSQLLTGPHRPSSGWVRPDRERGGAERLPPDHAGGRKATPPGALNRCRVHRPTTPGGGGRPGLRAESGPAGGPGADRAPRGRVAGRDLQEVNKPEMPLRAAGRSPGTILLRTGAFPR